MNQTERPLKKRIRCVFVLALAIAMMAGFMPGFVINAAADDTEVSYGLWVGETQVTDSNKEDILVDGIVSFDPETNTLTLNNAKLGVGKVSYGEELKSYDTGIHAKDMDITIDLLGDNSIDGKAGDSSYGIDVEGSGNLTIDGDQDGKLSLDNMYVAICSDRKISIKGGKVFADSVQELGVFSAGNITIKST